MNTTEQIMALIDKYISGYSNKAALQAAIEALVQERDEFKTRMQRLMTTQLATNKERDALKTDRDEWKDATLSANERFKKAEDALWKMGAERDALKAQEPVAWLTSAGKPVVLDQASSEQAKLYGWEPLYTRSKS